MRKLDKLVLSAFVGPFILTFLVVVFILLMQHMLKYFDDIIGKDLGGEVIGQLLFYFAIFMTPVAMPLAVLLSSLIAFGNLGEHFELTAIKASGISLLRTLQPIFFFVILLTGVAFYANNNLVPRAALEAYSLLYDIKQKKPALELREGAFYNGIPDISIKVNQKFADDPDALKEIIVYDHRKNDGNKEVTVADSGRMSTILNERYLKFELYNGYNYTEGAANEREMTGPKNVKPESLTRSKFDRSEIVFDLSSYDLKRTDKKWFEGNRIMRNLSELDNDIDSIQGEVKQQAAYHYSYRPTHFEYYRKKDTVYLPAEIYNHKLSRDSLEYKRAHGVIDENYRQDPTSIPYSPQPPNPYTPKKPLVVSLPENDSSAMARVDALYNRPARQEEVQGATNVARQIKSQLENTNASIEMYDKELAVFEIQWHKILASSLACVAMFLIGAPLGAIIKRGGLGIPFLVSILFFIVYYLLSMQGEKLAKNGTISAITGVWAADAILFVIGLFFLRQARIDARLFESDFYSVIFDKVKRAFKARKAKMSHLVGQ
ncbi:MAG TPA: LptF/LptG family permease [Chryseosolibacter sp.]